MHCFRDCGVSAVLQSSGMTYHCCPIEHTNSLKFLEKLFSCFKHNAIVNFLCKSIVYTLCLTILWGSSDDLYTAVVCAVLPCTHEKMTIFSGALKSVSVGIDGSCMLLTEGGWRESMVGTISLYDREGQRLHTIQMGATPEYGKKKCYGRFDQELSKVKDRYPKATCVAIADRARGNGPYLMGLIRGLELIDSGWMFGVLVKPFVKHWLSSAYAIEACAGRRLEFKPFSRCVG